MRVMEKEAGVLLSSLLPIPPPPHRAFSQLQPARLQLRSTCCCVHHLCVHLCRTTGLGAATKAGGAGGATGGHGWKAYRLWRLRCCAQGT
jgi:hypothetical protein